MKNKNYKIGASILSADFARLGYDVRRAENAGIDFVHIDIMDGKFVKNVTWGPETIKSLVNYTSLPLDVHLMIDQPENMLSMYIDSGASSISIHPESTVYIRYLLKEIRKNNIKAGIALKLETSLHSVVHLLDLIDFVVLLTCDEGFGGNKFLDISIEKIKGLVQMRREGNYQFNIEVDGGINLENMKKLYKLGVNNFVMGSSIYNSNDINGNLVRFHKLMENE